MTTFTNSIGLPEPVVAAIVASQEEYDRGSADISVTSLIAPPTQRALMEFYKDELTEDVADMVWSMMGQIGHGILEKSADKINADRLASALPPASLHECRMYAEFDGWTVSGKFDHLSLDEDGILSDYKFTTVWKFQSEDGEILVPPEYAQQENSYAEILARQPIPVHVRGLRVFAFLRDWSVREARRTRGYPQRQVLVIDVPLWTPEQRGEFILERVRLHKEARAKQPEALEPCTPDERWAKPEKFAAMKGQNKRATKVWDSESEAVAWLKSQTDAHKFKLVARPGESVRCRSYCSVAQWCAFGKAELAKAESEKPETVFEAGTLQAASGGSILDQTLGG